MCSVTSKETHHKHTRPGDTKPQSTTMVQVVEEMRQSKEQGYGVHVAGC